MVPGNLDSLLKSFNCINEKGNFPYNFVNKDNLFYVGDKPSISFYNNISNKDYDSILDLN